VTPGGIPPDRLVVLLEAAYQHARPPPQGPSRS
jgi:hypothetical protein